MISTEQRSERSRIKNPQATSSDGGSRILLFQTAFLGDLVLTLPLVEAIKQKWPNSSLSIVAIPSTAALVAQHPLVDDVIVYDKRGRDRSLWATLRFAAKLKKQKFDRVYSPHRSFRTALILALAAIPKRIGFAGTPGAFLYTERQPRNTELHETARNLRLLGEKSLAKQTAPILHPNRQAEQDVIAWMERHKLKAGQFVAMAPGSVWATKRWPWIHWTKLATAVSKEFSKPVVLVGGPDDQDLCGEIARKAGEHVYSAAGRFSIPASAELLRKASLLVTGDSAPLHLAVSVETPVLAIFGPTVPEFGFAPIGEKDRVLGLELDCRPCAIHGSDQCPLGHHHCMRLLEPERVASIVEEMLQVDGVSM